MFKTLLLKEIRETLHNFQFLIAVLLCFVLIPLGMYVGLKQYEQKHSNYRDAMRLYQERSEGKVSQYFSAEGYRPPSGLSIFSAGIEDYMPNKVYTSRDGLFRIQNESGVDNPKSLILGKIDFHFIVCFVLSVLALLFTFISISGERENGTLRLIVSNQVPRWKIILSKILGNYLVFLSPFITSFLFALLLVNFSGMINIFAPDILPRIVIILLVTLAFLFSMFNLGVLVSTLTRRSITTIISLLFIWVVLVLVIPKLSPMIAKILYPVKSQQVINLEIQNVRSSLKEELESKQKKLFVELLRKYKYNNESERNKELFQAMQQYDNEIIPLETEYEELINNEVGKIENDYKNKRNIQYSISENLSRISPVSCFTYIITELSNTGLLEMDNFRKHALQFQDDVKASVYDKYIIKRYSDYMGTWTNMTTEEEYDSKKAPVPQMVNYKNATLTDVFKNRWVDVVLIIIFNILFFAASFVSFIRYDVR